MPSEVVTTADAAPARARVSRPLDLATLAACATRASLRRSARRARDADVVYATSMVRRAAIGSGLARAPLVVKLVSDEVFERATRSGRYAGTLDEFQRVGGAADAFPARDTQLGAAPARGTSSARARISATSPSVGVSTRTHVSVLPNPAPAGARRCPRATCCERSSSSTVACSRSRGGSGRRSRSGPRSRRLRAVDRGRARDRRRRPRSRSARAAGSRARARGAGCASSGAVPRDQVLRLFRAADASLLPSAWENFPHTVMEALAVGCPVIATAVGGVPEVVRDGVNGLLVPPGDPAALASAVERLLRRPRSSVRGWPKQRSHR